jgi:hypothetical protein
MSGFVCRCSWRNGRALLPVLIILAILAVLVPQLAEARSEPVRLTISINRQNYAVLPTPLDNLCRDKRNDSDTCRRTVSIDSAPVSFRAFPYFIPDRDAIPNYVNSFCNTFIRKFRQACQLLDLPPPSVLSL